MWNLWAIYKIPILDILRELSEEVISRIIRKPILRKGIKEGGLARVYLEIILFGPLYDLSKVNTIFFYIILEVSILDQFHELFLYSAKAVHLLVDFCKIFLERDVAHDFWGRDKGDVKLDDIFWVFDWILNLLVDVVGEHGGTNGVSIDDYVISIDARLAYLAILHIDYI